MKILIASVVRQEEDVFRAHLACLRAQRLRGVETAFLYILDTSAPNWQQLVEVAMSEGALTLPSGPRPEGADYAVTSETHYWAEPTFVFLGREKDRILNYALTEGYDGVFLVDSDLLCGAETLQSLVDTGKDVVSAVFWTSWAPQDEPLPQVWQRHPYGFDAAGWTASDFLGRLRGHSLLRVRGLGACTLVLRNALERGASFAPVDGLPHGGMWQGEDRHFCIRAERLHIPMYADAWPRVWHCYRPEQRVELQQRVEELTSVSEGRTEVSISLETLDVPQLHAHREHLRGPLSALPVLPEIRETLATLPSGGSAFVTARFPASWPVRAGEETTLRVTLLDAR